jgi:hypothetical protein
MVRNTLLQDLLKRKMSRRQFFQFGGLAALSLFGVFRVIAELKSHASGVPNAFEPEDGTMSSPAQVVANSTASNGKGIKFGDTIALGAPGTYQPSISTTGWRRLRSRLTAHNGDIVVSTGGTVDAPVIIEGLLITGRVLVRAAYVTIRQCEIVGNGYSVGNTGLVDCNFVGASNVVVEDCELHQAVSTANIWHDAIIGHDYIAQRNYVYDVVDGFGVYNSNSGKESGQTGVEILANYVESLAYYSPDINHSDNRSHNDGVQIQSGKGTIIIGNLLHCYASTAVGNGSDQSAPARDGYFPYVTGHCITLTPVLSPISGEIVSRNWTHGGAGGYIAISNNGANPSNVGIITDNVFGTDMHFSTTPIQLDNNMSITTISGNTNSDNAPVTATFYAPGNI